MEETEPAVADMLAAGEVDEAEGSKATTAAAASPATSSAQLKESTPTGAAW